MPHFHRTFAALAMATMLAGGCVYVRMSESGAQVEERAAGDTLNCTLVRSITVQTTDKVVVSRSDRKVQEELLVLAHNEAGEVGANVITPDAPPQDGRQRFTAWNCPTR